MNHEGRSWSITDFLTTGSLAALVEELGRLIGCEIALHAIDGRRIRWVSGDPPWRIDEDPDEAIAQALREIPFTERSSRVDRRSLVPIRVAGQATGALVVEFPKTMDDARRAETELVLALVSETAAEFCSENVENRRRTSELALLLRISSLLVSTRDLDHSLSVALGASMQTFGADAGTIHLLDEDSTTLTLRASAGVSDAFIETFRQLPSDRVIDHEVLGGEIVCIEDLGADGGALHLDAISREGLTGLISAGLLFRGQTFGIMRLFTFRRLTLNDRERALARAVAEQISGAIAGARLVESERKRREYQRAVGLAADIQRRMLPNAPPRVPGIEVATRYVPSLELGGDFYDLIELGGSLGVVVGDVVGKGIPAALLMAAVRASLRAHAMDVYHLDEVIRRVNQALARDTHPNEFATVFYGVIEPTNLRLTYCNAGHDPPLVFRCSGADKRGSIDIFPLTAGGMVVGVDERAVYERATFQLRVGDLLVAYTDGVTDTMNFQSQKLGAARMRASISELLKTTPDATPEHAVNHLLWEINRFAGLRPKIDDVTIVCVRIGHGAPEASGV